MRFGSSPLLLVADVAAAAAADSACCFFHDITQPPRSGRAVSAAMRRLLNAAIFILFMRTTVFARRDLNVYFIEYEAAGDVVDVGSVVDDDVDIGGVDRASDGENEEEKEEDED